jgi:hypothetical protein
MAGIDTEMYTSPVDAALSYKQGLANLASTQAATQGQQYKNQAEELKLKNQQAMQERLAKMAQAQEQMALRPFAEAAQGNQITNESNFMMELGHIAMLADPKLGAELINHGLTGLEKASTIASAEQSRQVTRLEGVVKLQEDAFKQLSRFEGQSQEAIDRSWPETLQSFDKQLQTVGSSLPPLLRNMKPTPENIRKLRDAMLPVNSETKLALMNLQASINQQKLDLERQRTASTIEVNKKTIEQKDLDVAKREREVGDAVSYDMAPDIAGQIPELAKNKKELRRISREASERYMQLRKARPGVSEGQLKAMATAEAAAKWHKINRLRPAEQDWVTKALQANPQYRDRVDEVIQEGKRLGRIK